jgi:hypothetical protein
MVAADANSYIAESAASAAVHGAASRVRNSQTVSAAAAAPTPALRAASSESFEIASRQLAEQRAATPAAHKTIFLPSGLRAVSMATSRYRSIAIDSLGALFLTEDSGGHWQRVARQWNGRAVAVRVQDGLQAGGAAPAEAGAGNTEDKSNRPSIDTAVALPVPPAIFEIVNDSGQVWISTDGKTWKLK